MKKELKTFTVSVHERYRDEIARIRERESTARNFSEFVCEAILFYDRYKQVLEEQAKRLMGQWPLSSVSEDEIVRQIFTKQMQQTFPLSSSFSAQHDKGSDHGDASKKGEQIEPFHLLTKELGGEAGDQCLKPVSSLGEQQRQDARLLKDEERQEENSQGIQEKDAEKKTKVNKLARSLIF